MEELKGMVKVSFWEKLGFTSGDLGFNLVFQTISLFLLYFYTDIFKIPAAVVGTMFLIVRLWDAVASPAMGFIADRTNSRFGKYRPYMLFGAIPFAISAVLCFTTPDISTGAKVIYAYITYTLLCTIYNVISVPYIAMSAAITQDPNERVKISSFRMIYALVGAIVVAVSVPNLVKLFGNGNQALGYQLTMVLIGAAAAIFLLISFKSGKERIIEKNQEKINRKDFMQLLTKNRPMLILSIIFIVTFGANFTINAVAIYFCNYNLGMPDIYSILAVYVVFFTLAGISVTSVVSKRIGKKRLLIIAMFISFVGFVAFYFIPYKILAYVFIVKAVSSFGMGMVSALTWGMVPDTVEYGHYRTGIRAAGITTSILGFANDMGMALGGIIPGLTLAAVSYIPNVVQTKEALNGILLLNSLIPALLILIGFIMAFFYELNDKRYMEILHHIQSQEAKTEELS